MAAMAAGLWLGVRCAHCGCCQSLACPKKPAFICRLCRQSQQLVKLFARSDTADDIDQVVRRLQNRQWQKDINARRLAQMGQAEDERQQQQAEAEADSEWEYRHDDAEQAAAAQQKEQQRLQRQRARREAEALYELEEGRLALAALKADAGEQRRDRKRKRSAPAAHASVALSQPPFHFSLLSIGSAELDTLLEREEVAAAADRGNR